MSLRLPRLRYSFFVPRLIEKDHFLDSLTKLSVDVQYGIKAIVEGVLSEHNLSLNPAQVQQRCSQRVAIMNYTEYDMGGRFSYPNRSPVSSDNSEVGCEGKRTADEAVKKRQTLKEIREMI